MRGKIERPVSIGKVRDEILDDDFHELYDVHGRPILGLLEAELAQELETCINYHDRLVEALKDALQMAAEIAACTVIEGLNEEEAAAYERMRSLLREIDGGCQ